MQCWPSPCRLHQVGSAQAQASHHCWACCQPSTSIATLRANATSDYFTGRRCRWLCRHRWEYGSLTEATSFFSDDQAAIALTRDHQYYVSTRYIDMHYHWILWVIEQGFPCLVYCSTDDMVTEPLTKTLPFAKVQHFVVGLGLLANRGGYRKWVWSRMIKLLGIAWTVYDRLAHACLHRYI